MKVKGIWLLGAVMFLTISAKAEAGMQEIRKKPKVEYSADMQIKADLEVINIRVYYSPGKERQEISIKDGKASKAIMIFRHDKKVMWTLMPSEKMYMETSLDEAMEKSKDITKCDTCKIIERKTIGSEVVQGVKVTKEKIKTSCPEHGEYQGTMWFSKEDIMMKMEAVIKDTKTKKEESLEIELKNLKIGKQNPALFEVPKDYKRFSMKEMQGMPEMKEANEMTMEKLSCPECNKIHIDGRCPKGVWWCTGCEKFHSKNGKCPNGRHYTAHRPTEREYTSQPREDKSMEREYTSQPREDKLMDMMKNGLKGLFGK